MTMETLLARLETDLVRPVVFQGAMTAIARKPDNSTLFRLMRLSRSCPPAPDDSEFWEAAGSFEKHPRKS